MGLPGRIVELSLVFALAALPAAGADLRDLYFGEALYHAHQGEYFDALQRLDTELAQYHRLDEPDLDTLHYHIDDAEFSVGDLELNYRMHQRAGRAVKAVLEGAVEETVRNDAAFRLARIYFEKGQADAALEALSRIQGEVPGDIVDDIELLRANILMATGQPGLAVDVLRRPRKSDGQSDNAGFAAYNLGIALMQDGRPEEAVEQLDKAGLLLTDDPAGLAVRDKSNLVLGSILSETGDFDRAKQSLDRVRLEGPFSNQALLQAGSAEASAEQYDRALVPWNILVEREATDAAVQEAALAVPHAYASLNLHSRAAILYGRALELFSNQIEKVNASIGSIREGRFLKALIREESRQDDTWMIRLRSLPNAPETYYLMELMASHDFQTALHNYLDLEDLNSRLKDWATSLDAFDDIVGLRKENYDPLLPEIDEQFRKLDSRMRLRLQQHRQINEHLQAMLTSPRPDYLATAEERIAIHRLEQILEQTKAQPGDADNPETFAIRQRAARLLGMLRWRLETEYSTRLSAAYEHAEDLNIQIDALTEQYNSFIRARQAAMHSYTGYTDRIAGLRERIGSALKRVEILMTRQGQTIETAAINQLKARRERLLAQQTEARYGIADSYDRAARAQSNVEGP